ncbi:hypothetical protein LUZ60_012476 [Juncus effusus]|nr:hypothetical protein LUZ60_012476 [Juncus effusus]
MELTLIQWIIYCTTIFISLFFLYKSFSLLLLRPKYNLPPGPKPFPFIGNHQMIGQLPHRTVHSLSKKYGPIMYLRFGVRHIVIGSSIEMAKFIFKTNDVLYIDRPKFTGGKYFGYEFSDLAWAPYGPYWRQARKLFMTEILSAKRVESFRYIREEEVQSFLLDLYKSKGGPLVLKDFSSKLNINLMCRIVLGKRFNDMSDENLVSLDEFKRMIEEFFRLTGALNIGDYIPWLNFLDLQGYIKQMKLLCKRFDVLYEQIIDKHEEVRRLNEGKDDSVPKDMVDVLLQILDDPTLEVKISRDGVKGFIQNLITAGTESGSVTVEWAASELLKKPETLHKAIEELDRVIGKDRLVEEKDMQNLPYMEAIVKETMRLHPVNPLTGLRLSREDTTVLGYHIPAGTQIYVNVWSIGRDPGIWKSPDEFNPDRFIGSMIDVKGQDFELLPFGSGRRMCPGYNLGLKMIQMSLANLLHAFRLDFSEGMKKEELSMDEIFGITTMKKVPLRILVEPKLSPHLYGV